MCGQSSSWMWCAAARCPCPSGCRPSAAAALAGGGDDVQYRWAPALLHVQPRVQLARRYQAAFSTRLPPALSHTAQPCKGSASAASPPHPQVGRVRGCTNVPLQHSRWVYNPESRSKEVERQPNKGFLEEVGACFFFFPGHGARRLLALLAAQRTLRTETSSNVGSAFYNCACLRTAEPCPDDVCSCGHPLRARPMCCMRLPNCPPPPTHPPRRPAGRDGHPLKGHAAAGGLQRRPGLLDRGAHDAGGCRVHAAGRPQGVSCRCAQHATRGARGCLASGVELQRFTQPSSSDCLGRRAACAACSAALARRAGRVRRARAACSMRRPRICVSLGNWAGILCGGVGMAGLQWHRAIAGSGHACIRSTRALLCPCCRGFHAWFTVFDSKGRRRRSGGGQLART